MTQFFQLSSRREHMKQSDKDVGNSNNISIHAQWYSLYVYYKNIYKKNIINIAI